MTRVHLLVLIVVAIVLTLFALRLSDTADRPPMPSDKAPDCPAKPRFPKRSPNPWSPSAIRPQSGVQSQPVDHPAPLRANRSGHTAETAAHHQHDG